MEQTKLEQTKLEQTKFPEPAESTGRFENGTYGIVGRSPEEHSHDLKLLSAVLGLSRFGRFLETGFGPRANPHRETGFGLWAKPHRETGFGPRATRTVPLRHFGSAWLACRESWLDLFNLRRHGKHGCLCVWG